MAAKRDMRGPTAGEGIERKSTSGKLRIPDQAAAVGPILRQPDVQLRNCGVMCASGTSIAARCGQPTEAAASLPADLQVTESKCTEH